MVEHQLRSRGVRDENVLAAMGRVPREDFVPGSLAGEAYFDCALPIDCDQTISQPIIVGPFGPEYEQALYETHKIAGQPRPKILTGCRFVPLVTTNPMTNDKFA